MSRNSLILARAFVLTLLMAALIVSSAIATDESRPSARDLASVEGVSGPDISPDGKWLVYSLNQWTHDADAKPSEKDTKAGWSSERQIYMVAAKGGEPRQLTFGEENASSPMFSPSGSEIAFLRQRDGNRSIHILSLEGGEAQAVDTGEFEPGGVRWSPDGSGFAFLADVPESDEDEASAWRRGGAFDWEEQWTNTQLFLVDRSGAEPTALTSIDENVVDYAWSPDAKRLIVTTSRNADPYEAYSFTTPKVIDATDGHVIATLEEKGTAIGRLAFSPSGKLVAYERIRGTLSILNEIAVHDLESATRTNAAAALDPTLAGFVWKNDDTLVAHVLEKTRSSLYELPVDGSKARKIATLDRALHGSFHPTADRKTAALLSSTLAMPATPTTVDLRNGNTSVATQTNAQVAEWTGFDAEVVRWMSPEGVEIEGVLAQTRHRQSGEAPPLLVLPHGGPDSVTRESFSSWMHYFTARGFSVLRPNYRGGTAYGFDFYAANRGRLGEIEFMDIEAGVDHLIAEGKADPNRLLYGGWSWGGYLTAWTIGHTDRYVAAVAGAAVTDVVAQYVGSDINHGFAAQWEYKGNPWQQTENFDRSDPIRFAKNATTPTLIIHGQGDDRVPFSQGLTLYRALVDVGCETRFLAYPREPHGFREPAHVEHFLTQMANWYLDRVEVDSAAESEAIGASR